MGRRGVEREREEREKSEERKGRIREGGTILTSVLPN